MVFGSIHDSPKTDAAPLVTDIACVCSNAGYVPYNYAASRDFNIGDMYAIKGLTEAGLRVG